MAWFPKNKHFSTENFSTHETGSYIYSDFDAQNNIGGVVALRNIATGKSVIIPAGEPWPPIAWKQRNDFDMLWSANSGDFTKSGATPVQNLSYGTIAFVGYNSIANTGSWSWDNGLLVESEWTISRLTGSTTESSNQYGLLMQYTGSGTEGFETVTLQREPIPGFVIGKDSSHETFVPATGLGSQVIGFRYGIRGNTGHFITTEGYSAYIDNIQFKSGYNLTGAFNTGDGTESWCVIGDLSEYFTGSQVDSSSRVECGKLYQNYPVYDIAGDFIADTYYSTGAVHFTSSSFNPSIAIANWEKAYVKIIGSINTGTCIIHAEYSDDGSSWATGISSSSFNTGGLYNIDLTSIPVGDRNNAQIRFTVEQASSDGVEPPCQIDYITVTFSPSQSATFLYSDPIAGSAAGEYPVLISIDPNDRSHVRPYPTGDAIFMTALTGGVGTTSYFDKVSGFTGTTSDGSRSTVKSIFGRDAHGFRNYTGLSSTLTGIFRRISNESQLSWFQQQDDKLASTQDFQYLFADSVGETGELTGAYTGTIGSRLIKFNYPGAPDFAYDRLNVASIPFGKSGAYETYVGQSWKGSVGHGFQTPTLGFSGTSDDYMVIESVIQVSRGGLCITLDEVGADYQVDPCYPIYRYNTPTRVYTIFPMPTGDVSIQVYGVSDNYSAIDTGLCAWIVASMNVYGMNNDSIQWLSNPINEPNPITDNMLMDVWLRMDGHPRHETVADNSIFSITGTNGSQDYSMGLGLDSKGRPVWHYSGSSIQTITGQFGLTPAQWHHLSLMTMTGDYYVMSLDGELCAMQEKSVGEVPQTGNVIIGQNFIGAVSDARLITGDTTPVEQTVFHAFSAPLKFNTHYQLPTGDAQVLYRFDRGTLWDRGTGLHGRCIIPEDKYRRFWTERDAEGVFGEGIEFQGSYGGAVGVTDVNVNSSTGGWIGLWLAFLPDGGSDTYSRVWKIGDTQFDITNDLIPRYSYSGHTLTGISPISDNFQYGWITLEHRITGGSTDVYCYYSTGQPTGDLLLTGTIPVGDFNLTGQICFGHDPDVLEDRGSIFLDEFGIFTGALPDPTGRYMHIDYKKTAPTEYIYINNSVVTGSRVSHLGVYDKELIMPPQTDFSATGAIVHMSVDTDAGRISIMPNFTYIGARRIILETGNFGLWAESRDKLCKTKSPFRIGTRVPDDGVNLAFISSPDFSVSNNLGIVDSAGGISDNYVASLKPYDALSSITGDGTTGETNTYLYTGEVDTDDILITTYTMQRQTAGFAAPLFYRYKLGRDDLWLYQVGATGLTSTDIDLIRNSIKITDQDGETVSIEDFPWDIRISNKRDDDFVLPSNVYNVEILSRDRFMPGRSLFVEFNAADPTNTYAQVKGWRECINPEPIYMHVNPEISVGQTFSTIDTIRFSNLSSGRYNAGPIIKINQLTGDWCPSIHSNLFREDDFIY